MTGRRSYSSAQARSTSHVIETVMSLDDGEFERLLSLLERGSGREDFTQAYWAHFFRASTSWLTWEEECRGSTRGSACAELVPEDAREGTIATYFATAIKTVIMWACEDLGVDWLLPHWVRWYAHHAGSPERLGRLYDLPLEEQVSRMVDYSVYVWGLHALAKAVLERYEPSSGPASATAMYIYWDIVDPLYEYVMLGVEPLGREYVRLLSELSYRVYGRAKRLLEGEGGRLGLGGVLSAYATKLRRLLADSLVEERMARRRSSSSIA